MSTRPSVYQYLDYRSFLRDYYLFGKEKGLSYRSISRRAGITSSNYLKLVIESQRNLTEETAARIAQAVQLEGQSAEFFCSLVRFNQAKTASARAAAYERIVSFRRYREIRQLDAAQADYHSNWYIPAIFELLARADFQDDPEWIAHTLCPAISTRQAKKALQTLLQLDLVRRDDDGRLVRHETLLTTGPETRGVHVANYHRSMMSLAATSLDRFVAADRDISGLTLCLGPEGIKQLKERIARFRREMLELSETETEPTQVIQVNFQVFPLSTR